MRLTSRCYQFFSAGAGAGLPAGSFEAGFSSVGGTGGAGGGGFGGATIVGFTTELVEGAGFTRAPLVEVLSGFGSSFFSASRSLRSLKSGSMVHLETM